LTEIAPHQPDRTQGIALVRRPGPRITEGLVTHIERGAVDPERAAQQHAAYRKTLREAGWDVREAARADDFPDAAFVEDVTVFLDRRAVLTHPGDPSRRGEVESLASMLALIGIPTVPLGGDGTLDGGDVIRTGDKLFVGQSTRTNEAGFAALAEHAAEEGIEARPVKVDGCLHLKTGATALPDGAILADVACVDTEAFGSLEIVEAPEPLGANVLMLGGDRIIAPASAPKTIEVLRDRGLQVEVLDISEFESVEAGLTCLSVLLRGVGTQQPAAGS
jgi:dimethylargininase